MDCMILVDALGRLEMVILMIATSEHDIRPQPEHLNMTVIIMIGALESNVYKR